MNKSLLVFYFVFHSCFMQAQLANDTSESVAYKEDQFYLGITYNLLGSKPSGVSQNGFSPGLHLGVIKDIPIHPLGTKAIALGLGYSYNLYNDNIYVSPSADSSVTYRVLSDEDGSTDRNRLITHTLELPLEFRWRTSTAESYKFWRIYTGIKASYVFAHKHVYKGDLGDLSFTNNPDVNAFQYGLTLSFGYNTWNFHVYYGLNAIYDENALIDATAIKTKPIKIGLMFYIL